MSDIFYKIIITLFALIALYIIGKSRASKRKMLQAEKKWAHLPRSQAQEDNIPQAVLKQTTKREEKKSNSEPIISLDNQQNNEDQAVKIEPKITQPHEAYQTMPSQENIAVQMIHESDEQEQEQEQESQIRTHSSFYLQGTQSITYRQLQEFFAFKYRDKMLKLNKSKHCYFYQTNGVGSYPKFAIIPLFDTNFMDYRENTPIEGIRLYLSESKDLLQSFNPLYEMMKDFKRKYPDFEMFVLKDGTGSFHKGDIFTEALAEIFKTKLQSSGGS